MTIKNRTNQYRSCVAGIVSGNWKKSLRVLAQTPENPVDCHVLSERGFSVLLFICDLHIKQVLWDKSN